MNIKKIYILRTLDGETPKSDGVGLIFRYKKEFDK